MTTPIDPRSQPGPSEYQPPQAFVAPPLDGRSGTYPPVPGGFPPPTVPGGFPPPIVPGGFPSQTVFGGYPPPTGPAVPLPPPARPSKGRAWKVVAIVLGAVLVLLAGFVILGFVVADDTSLAEPGECINYVSETVNHVVDCASGEAQYVVESRLESSSPTACDAVGDSDLAVYSKDDGESPFTLCLSVLLRVGSCVSEDFDLVDCADPAAYARVTTIHQGTTDVGACGKDMFARTYDRDQRVVCLAEVA